MLIKSIKIKDFRNIEDLEIDNFKQTNIIYGLNAQGKTSIIEAISFISTLKSFRGDDNQDLVRWEKEFSVVEIELAKNTYKQKMKVVINKNSQKMFINNKEVKRNCDFIGNLNVITFSPDDVFMFKNSPKIRRDFLDEELSKLSPSYYVARLQQSKLLKERNELLKNNQIDETYLQILTSQLAKANSEIAKKRQDLINSLSNKISNKFKELSKENNLITIQYQNQFDGEYDIKFIEKKIVDNFEEDQKRLSTQIGVHKDDFVVMLNNKPISHYGSQGQNRLAAIALKLAAIEIVKEKSGEEVVVILDDVLSELDDSKKENLLNALQIENQIFITTTERTNYLTIKSKDILEKEIKDGKIRKEE